MNFFIKNFNFMFYDICDNIVGKNIYNKKI